METSKAMSTRREISPKALVLSFSDLRADPRVRRQLGLLCERFNVTAAGFTAPAGIPVHSITVPPVHWPGAAKATAALLLATGAYERAYWSSHCVQAARNALKETSFALVVANDLWTLPLAIELSKGAKVLFDAHEFAPREFEESFKWRFFFQRYNEFLCRRYLHRVDAAITVCDGIAEEFHRAFGVHMKVVLNAPPFQELAPSPADPKGTIRLVHHGGAIPSRQLEVMIEAMRHLDDHYTLDFVLVPSVPRYLDQLKSVASGDSRIRFLPPVDMNELPRFLNRYDAGIYLLPPNNFNNRHALPNKFFEFVQARLAIVIGPSPEMAKEVRRYDMGVIADDFTPQSFARAISGLTPQSIAQFKGHANSAARELCFERSATVLTQVINRMRVATCAD